MITAIGRATAGGQSRKIASARESSQRVAHDQCSLPKICWQNVGTAVGRQASQSPSGDSGVVMSGTLFRILCWLALETPLPIRYKAEHQPLSCALWLDYPACLHCPRVPDSQTPRLPVLCRVKKDRAPEEPFEKGASASIRLGKRLLLFWSLLKPDSFFSSPASSPLLYCLRIVGLSPLAYVGSFHASHWNEASDFYLNFS